ncbi:MAG: hybrid sensor histidine kinase/response regulator, partial [Nitrospinae bacterium]|nr:hybrid sensor histidine kinase/response regulator [Nitrospinota bacterium]
RLTVAGNDEIGELSTAVNLMLSDLEKLQGELREAKETAEDATKLKDHFVSLVAHDLRSPLSTIMGMLRLLQSGRHQISEEKRADVIAKVIHSAHNMITVIEDLLNISLLQTGKIQPVPAFFDGARVVESCINAMEFTADGKGVKVVNGVVPGTRLYADFTMFGEVLKNLISNSIKFCRAGDTVTVFVPEGEPSTIAVRDTGVGINPAFYPDLFRHEVKTTSSGTGEERGTGLGLPYSRDIMLAHGGDLSADAPKPGEGALFRARLPLVRPVVLVVDDDERLLEDIALLMAQDKLEVIKASSEDEAVRIIETRKPHLVIANSHLTGADALSLVQRLKEDNPRATVPLIVITPENSGISGESLMPLGVRDVLAKPFKVHDLISRVKKYVA